MTDEKEHPAWPNETLKAWVEAVVKTGPTRVVIDVSGEATTPERALRDYRVKPDIVYIRDDGWSLGTPAQFDTVANGMWRDHWVAVVWLDGGVWWWRRFGVNEPAMEV